MYKIYHLDDFNEDLNDENWLMTLDISILYKKYESKEIDFKIFIEKFNQFLVSKREKFSKLSNECLTDINKLIEECDVKSEEDFYKYVDNVYDWSDKYAINIKCNEEKNETYSRI